MVHFSSLLKRIELYYLDSFYRMVTLWSYSLDTPIIETVPVTNCPGRTKLKDLFLLELLGNFELIYVYGIP